MLQYSKFTVWMYENMCLWSSGKRIRKDMSCWIFVACLMNNINRCLRRILIIHWLEVISNEELWRRAEEIEISIQIKRRKWNWIGHTLRKGHDIIEREVLDWNPQGQRKRGRPKQTWRRSVHNEALGEGKSWGEVKQLTRNRIRWRRLLTPYVPKGITGYDDDDDDD